MLSYLTISYLITSYVLLSYGIFPSPLGRMGFVFVSIGVIDWVFFSVWALRSASLSYDIVLVGSRSVGLQRCAMSFDSTVMGIMLWVYSCIYMFLFRFVFFFSKKHVDKQNKNCRRSSGGRIWATIKSH